MFWEFYFFYLLLLLLRKQIVEYIKPAYVSFVALQKVFDRIPLKDSVHLLTNRGIPLNIIKTIEKHPA